MKTMLIFEHHEDANLGFLIRVQRDSKQVKTNNKQKKIFTDDLVPALSGRESGFELFVRSTTSVVCV